MNSIYLILLLLCCCNHGSENGCRHAHTCGNGNDGCGTEDVRRKHTYAKNETCEYPETHTRRDDNPFSPFDGGGECKKEKYPEFRGNKGPCGCEDQCE